jgi:hypothetical protein
MAIKNLNVIKSFMNPETSSYIDPIKSSNWILYVDGKDFSDVQNTKFRNAMTFKITSASVEQFIFSMDVHYVGDIGFGRPKRLKTSQNGWQFDDITLELEEVESFTILNGLLNDAIKYRNSHDAGVTGLSLKTFDFTLYQIEGVDGKMEIIRIFKIKNFAIKSFGHLTLSTANSDALKISVTGNPEKVSVLSTTTTIQDEIDYSPSDLFKWFYDEMSQVDPIRDYEFRVTIGEDSDFVSAKVKTITFPICKDLEIDYIGNQSLGKPRRIYVMGASDLPPIEIEIEDDVENDSLQYLLKMIDDEPDYRPDGQIVDGNKQIPILNIEIFSRGDKSLNMVFSFTDLIITNLKTSAFTYGETTIKNLNVNAIAGSMYINRI